MSDPIIPAPRVQPPIGPQVTPQFNYSGSSYAPRPDTISSMKTFAKKNAGWILFGTAILGLLYAFWSFITRSTSSSDDSKRSDRRARGVGRRTEKPPGEEVIIGKSDVKVEEILSQYRMLFVILTSNSNQSQGMTLSTTRGMMNKLGSSDSFAWRIMDDGNSSKDRIAAFRELIHAFIDKYGTELKEYKIAGASLPETYYTLASETGEYPIVTAFAKIFSE